ncbi:MAG: hypothetical protein ACLTSL_15765 [Odoribacter splanchnicus]
MLKTDFPFAKFCVYHGEIISPLQHHFSPNRTIYIETERNRSNKYRLNYITMAETSLRK